MATDADAYFPFASGAGQITTVAQWEDYAGDLLRDGVLLGRGSEHAVFADSTGMQVKVPTGRVCIRGHRGVLTAQKTLGIAANGTSNGRVDRVVARLDVTNSKVVYDVLTGTPSGTPVAPALTQTSTTWELSLAQVSVPAGDTTIDPGQVTDERMFAFPFGVEIGDWHITSRTSVAHSAEVFLQGQVVSRVTYASLFSLWGTTYGAGDGSTTFQLPNMQGRVPVGRNAGDPDFGSLGNAPGEKRHILTQPELPSVSTGLEDANHNHQVSFSQTLIHVPATPEAVPGGTIPLTVILPPTTTPGAVPYVAPTDGMSNDHRHPLGGSNAALNVMQPSLVVNYAIRAR